MNNNLNIFFTSPDDIHSDRELKIIEKIHTISYSSRSEFEENRTNDNKILELASIELAKEIIKTLQYQIIKDPDDGLVIHKFRLSDITLNDRKYMLDEISDYKKSSMIKDSMIYAVKEQMEELKKDCFCIIPKIKNFIKKFSKSKI